MVRGTSSADDRSHDLGPFTNQFVLSRTLDFYPNTGLRTTDTMNAPEWRESIAAAPHLSDKPCHGTDCKERV